MTDQQEPLQSAGKAPHATPLGKFERALMAFSMGLLCVLTMINVLVRHFTNFAFASTEEISVVLLVIMTLVGASHAFATKHHIAITFFAHKTARLRALSAQLSVWASLLMFGLLTGYGLMMTWDDYAFEVTSPSLGIPQWYYTMWLPLLSALIVVRLLVSLVRR